MSFEAGLSHLRDHGPDPIVESGLLVAWLMDRANVHPGSGLVTLAPGTAGDTAAPRGHRVSGAIHGVPWARHADVVVVALNGRLFSLAAGDITIETGSNLADDPRDTVLVSDACATAVTPIPEDTLMMWGALTRVALMTGSLERIAALTVRHARTRRQFGRPIAAFQAVQALLVTIAQQAALVTIANDAASHTQAPFEIAVAKLLANQAGITATRSAHQVHGAHGMALAHPLGVDTRRLWAWRSEYGTERYWSVRLGTAAVEAGADALYPAITGGSAALKV
jgi:acyl-CoA dehydrogenase